jgi:hypothetical protein
MKARTGRRAEEGEEEEATERGTQTLRLLFKRSASELKRGRIDRRETYKRQFSLIFTANDTAERTDREMSDEEGKRDIRDVEKEETFLSPPPSSHFLTSRVNLRG